MRLQEFRLKSCSMNMDASIFECSDEEEQELGSLRVMVNLAARCWTFFSSC